MQVEQKELITSNIVLAAALIVSGFKLTRMTKAGMKGTFEFTESDPLELTKFIGKYSIGDVRVEPKAFHAKIRELSTDVRGL